MPKNTGVLIVEGHPLFSRGLAALIRSIQGYSVVGEAGNRADAIKLAEKEKPALVTVDIDIADGNGMDLIPQLKLVNQDMAILVVSMHDERYYSERVLRLGARGYVMKDKAPDTVMEAIHTVMSGKVYLSDPERERLFEAMTGESLRGVKDWAMSVRKLSDRELQIFSCIGKGLGTIEIAAKYQLSTKTIDTHKEHIKLKLHCNTSQELRRFAIEWANHSGRENP